MVYKIWLVPCRYKARLNVLRHYLFNNQIPGVLIKWARTEKTLKTILSLATIVPRARMVA